MIMKIVLDRYWEDPSFGLCSSASVTDYIFVGLAIGANLEFLEKEYYFSLQNGHRYYSNDYSCPVNEFTVYADSGFVQRVMDIDDLDGAEYLISDYELDCTPEQILELKSYIEAHTPTLKQLGYSEDIEDYLYFNEEGEEVEMCDYANNRGWIEPKEKE